MRVSKLLHKINANLDMVSGALLFLCAILAFAANNIEHFRPLYDAFRSIRISVSVNSFAIDKPFILWINDGLMALFFLLVGLEIKREIMVGQLRSFQRIILPLVGALGGIASTPVLNPPEVAIIGVNKVRTAPVWNGEAFEPRQLMNLSCSFDHRIIDGQAAAKFVAAMKRRIEACEI